jgi:hypothetical protein
MKLNNRVTVADRLDYDDELEFEVETNDYATENFYLTREKIIDLIAHLQKIIAK